MTTSITTPGPSAVEEAVGLMTRFAERTGLASALPPERYLWTDAFAVCNFLGLAQATGEAHATRGGLRIGKALPERTLGEPFDEELEWQRDGQYFHYLTKWMHALNQVYRWTGQSKFNTWARELAAVAHEAFTCADGVRRRMVWKMSTDLSRPLVSSMGHHDPLDGFITCIQLRTTQSSIPQGPSLEDEVADFATMIAGKDWATADPLGLGGLLADASRVAQLTHREARTWSEHRDINEVMLATSLVPNGFLSIRQGGAA